MWHCAQIGAREHYAVARSLYRKGRFSRLYTDFWMKSYWKSISNLTGNTSNVGALNGRKHREIPNHQVSSFNFTALMRMLAEKNSNNVYDEFIQTGSRFSKNVKIELSRNGASAGDTFFSYDTGFLEAAQYSRQNGIKSIVCQMDPAVTEQKIVAEERALWAGWEGDSPSVPDAYNERRIEEWKTADYVMVNSEWSQNALIDQGVPANKIRIIPLAFEAGGHRSIQKGRDGTFRVLWIGQVILRKGIQYLMEAARRLSSYDIEFLIVGPVGISKQAISGAPENMKFSGPMNRNEVADAYRDADVFALPTLSDGFAITQLESMAYGLPVIATPNCAKVVKDGQNGLLVPPKDPDALAEAIIKLYEDRNLLAEMRESSISTVSAYSVDALGDRLVAFEDEIFNKST